MGSDEPKYLNSPETAAYTKGQHLYGLFQAKDEIRVRKFAILVEGYLDLIALHQFGIRNTAASLGTALTPEQAKLLSRFTRKVVINYDGDSAGIKAARRAIEHLLPLDLETKVLTLPDGQDPDDFVRQNGADAYNARRGKAKPFLQFALEASTSGRDIKNPKAKADAIEDFLPIVSAIRNNIQRRETFDQAMDFFHVEDSGLRRELWNSLAKQGVGGLQQITQKISRVARPKMTVAERRLLEILINDPDLCAVVVPKLETSDYAGLATGEIFAAVIHARNNEEQITHEYLSERITDDDEMLVLAQGILDANRGREKDEVMDEALREAENCVVSLRDMAIAHRTLEISREAAIAERSGDTELFNQLTYEQLELEKIRRELTRQTADV
jgi:DNA primase